MTRSLGHPVSLERLGNTPESRLPLGELFWAAADLSRAARLSERYGIAYANQHRFGRLGMLGAGWELSQLERAPERSFLISQQLSEREYDEDRRIPLKGWQAIGIATIRQCSLEQMPESLRLRNRRSVRLDHWLAPEQHASIGVNRAVISNLLQEVTEGDEGPVWTVCRVQDTERFDAMRHAGMRPMETPHRYPELAGGNEAMLQLWVKEPVT